MPTNKLTDSKLKSLKPKDRPYKQSDGDGLSILVTPQGSKLWELAYRFDGKQKSLRFGAYPLVTLADARGRRDDAKRLLLQGEDPSAKRKEPKASHVSLPANHWKDLAENWLAKCEREGAKPATIKKNRWHLGHTFPALGHLPVDGLTMPDFVPVLQEIEMAGKLSRHNAPAPSASGSVGSLSRAV